MSVLKEKELEGLMDELLNTKRPIFLFDDDTDGLCSFLLLYRFVREGKGIAVKSRPIVDLKFAKRVIDYEADKVFILDVAKVKQEFVDEVKRPVIWVDHHEPVDIQKVYYVNPRKHVPDIVYPVTNVCFDVVKKDIWIAMTGCVGDWYLPEFTSEFCKQFPDLMDEKIKNPGKALFTTKLGKLVKILNFVLKGSNREVMSSVKVLTRIKSPYEILNQTSSQGKFIHKRFETINKNYEDLLKEAKKKESSDKFLIFTYPDEKMSFSGELSNELLYLFPDKFIIVGREKSGDVRMSLRSSSIHIPKILSKALIGVEGYGGGHENACGANVRKKDFEEFVGRLRKEISE